MKLNRTYWLLYSRPGGCMNWPGYQVRSNARIRAVLLTAFRGFFGSPATDYWHKDGLMAEAWDKRGNKLELQQINQPPTEACHPDPELAEGDGSVSGRRANQTQTNSSAEPLNDSLPVQPPAPFGWKIQWPDRPDKAPGYCPNFGPYWQRLAESRRQQGAIVTEIIEPSAP